MNYKLTGETIEFEGHTLHRIRATVSFTAGQYNVRKGQRGGWVEESASLEMSSWVGGEAVLMGNSRMAGSYAHCDKLGAVVVNNSIVKDSHILVAEMIRIDEGAVFDSKVYDSVRVTGYVKRSTLHGESEVRGTVLNSTLSGHVIVGNMVELNRATITGPANIEKDNHYLDVNRIGSEGVRARLWRVDKHRHVLRVGCWTGELDSLMDEVDRRRETYWSTDPNATVELWTAQYEALLALGKAVVGTWE